MSPKPASSMGLLFALSLLTLLILAATVVTVFFSYEQVGLFLAVPVLRGGDGCFPYSPSYSGGRL